MFFIKRIENENRIRKKGQPKVSKEWNNQRMPFKSYIKHKLIPLLKIPGSKAYLVGGALRDLILGAQPEDFDLIVSGDPGLYARMLADRIKGRCCILGRPPKAVHRIHAPGMVVDVQDLHC